ncbi:cytochrome b/b6 domain-containing protein [Nereida sp. MMG025]|uniref:cytochrome b/b6 domain-containing protein n=1 Tax=Nereida sp. MMG025 TaxID=2909981 RepID=UPI001F01F619|nr:cytochrome b/b6 domain-containing protein [Nereida sp. MMG025]MCF6443501.1 cytochrome b/b6 domain-containing protein [Nereida sp. MMG025]
MAIANTATRYGSVARFFHWTIAIGIFTVIPLGVIAHNLSLGIKAGTASSETIQLTATLFSLHKTIGLVIFFTALARIFWAVTQPKPAPLARHKGWEHTLSAVVHWLLYGSLVLVPLTGWIHHASTSGFAPIWWPFGQSLPFVAQTAQVAEVTANLHLLFERVMVIALALHIAGALKHHFVDRDDTLRRMAGGACLEPTTQPHGRALPLAGALGVWVIALGIGGAAGLYSTSEAAQVDALEQATGEWQVVDGTIGLTITQFGSQVDGAFADWTADIAFTPPSTPDGADATGRVTTTINIPSLQLGSVTDQALGPDFFDADTFPTATYEGTITGGDDETYMATGTLTIRDQSMPVSFPFTMTLEGDTATMSGTVRLNRMDFNIGASMADESSLLFGVDVQIALTATRRTD